MSTREDIIDRAARAVAEEEADTLGGELLAEVARHGASTLECFDYPLEVRALMRDPVTEGAALRVEFDRAVQRHLVALASTRADSTRAEG